MKPFVLIAAVLALSIPALAGVKVRVDADKTVDFTKFKTWAWSQGVGDIMLARTPKDDPEELRKRAEPIIVDTVASQLPQRGLQMAKDSPDLTLRYYLLITIGTNTQQMGQFVPTVLDWGLPLFAPATTSYKVIQSGALVMDLRQKDKVVWRAVAEAEIKMDMPQDKRAALLKDAVTQAFEKYPPKTK
jgi:hypothetical protein